MKVGGRLSKCWKEDSEAGTDIIRCLTYEDKTNT